MKTILLTGAAGFVGSHTAKLLLEQGNKVIGVDNMNDYYDVALKKHRVSHLLHENFIFKQIDIENKEALREIFSIYKVDAVINLAARAGVRYSMENPSIYMTTNAMGSLNILDLMREFGVKKFVLASTSSLYAGQEMPFLESLPVNEPISPYAATKKAAEVMAYTYHFLYKIDVSIVRYFTVYGPAGRPDMSIFRFIKWIDQGQAIELFGDGTQSRDFTFVSDIAHGTIAALKDVGYEIINLGGGTKPVVLKEVVSMIESVLGKRATLSQRPFHIADLKSTRADITKAKKILNWEPKVKLDEGIKATIDWYLENKEMCLSIKL